MLKAYSYGGGALKSIPLNAVPPDAWRSLTGAGDSGDLQQLYDSVPWLYRGVNAIAEALENMPWEFHNRAGEVVEEPRLPFGFDTGTIMNAAAGDYILYGAIYWHKGINVAKRPTQCQRWHPSTVTPKYDDMKGLVAFERRFGSFQEVFSVQDVAYVWHTNRKAELGPGTPPAQAALKAAGLLDNTTTYATQYFANGAVEPTLLFIDGNPSDADLTNIEGRLRRMATGIAKAFKLIALRFKPEAIKIGSTPDKLALPELTTSKREDVATALGIPQSILFSNASNFATARQDDLNFYDKLVVPLSKRIAQTLSDDVFSPFGLELRPHPERMELYQALEAEKAEALAIMIDRRVITGNEYRDAMNYDERDDPAFDEPGVPRRESEEDDMLNAQAGADDAELSSDDNLNAQQMMELRKWRRFVEKRVKDGKSLDRPFVSAILPRTLVSALEGSLHGAQSVDEVKRVFADAAHFVGYP